MKSSVDQLISAARQLGRSVGSLEFSPPVAFVYNPLSYAWRGHENYLRKFGTGRKRVLFLGMNPGPFGMVQTGVPFGEVSAVKNFLGLSCSIGKPERQHPARPILGYDCPRSEISGQRIWGLFASRFGSCEAFFREHLVINYCPLAFMEESGRNLTPDKLPRATREELYEICNKHLRRITTLLKPEWVVGVGDFAVRRARESLAELPLQIGGVLHPSPASPAANRDWAGKATAQLVALGVW